MELEVELDLESEYNRVVERVSAVNLVALGRASRHCKHVKDDLAAFMVSHEELQLPFGLVVEESKSY